jgi:uncharacterized integral membrane protein
MNQLLWLLKWVLRVAIFFVLLAFALNNEHDVTVNLVFGHELTLPLVLVVLCAFTIGLIAGVVAMMPRWYKQRRAASKARRSLASTIQDQEPRIHES